MNPGVAPGPVRESKTQSDYGMDRLIPVERETDIPEKLRHTPIGNLLEYLISSTSPRCSRSGTRWISW